MCDPIWHVSSRSGEASCELLYSVYLFTFTFIICSQRDIPILIDTLITKLRAPTGNRVVQLVDAAAKKRIKRCALDISDAGKPFRFQQILTSQFHQSIVAIATDCHEKNLKRISTQKHKRWTFGDSLLV